MYKCKIAEHRMRSKKVIDAILFSLVVINRVEKRPSFLCETSTVNYKNTTPKQKSTSPLQLARGTNSPKRMETDNVTDWLV